MSSHHGSADAGGLKGAIRGFAVLLALCLTVFLAPQIWPLADGAVWGWLNGLYGLEAASWLHLGIQVATWPLTFFALRAGLMAGFTAIVILIAKRMM